ncbi:MAG: pyridoxal phosphate-dependent aminotransferase [Candidatus Omnitrophica bacterium]|nr:pyridoxal phosphate-dependent aminotransferase [Candidatus Omnitrophota bacterium]
MREKQTIAHRLEKIKPSATLAVTSKAKKLKSEGKDVVNFAAGEPDFDTPEFIKNAACRAIAEGFTKYTPSTGTAELKELIASKLKHDNGLEYSKEQIVVSCGAKHSIFNTLFSLVNPADEVLVPLPYWVSYPEMISLCEGVPQFITTSAKNNFKFTPEELTKHINHKTKLLILNSPANPTGSVYSEKELKEIADICVQNDIFVLSDEIYEKLIYDNHRHVSIASFNKNIYSRTITVNGLSKSYSMTGWRIGYLGASPEIAGAISKIQDHSTSNPASISQKAAVAALQDNSSFSEDIRLEFQKRRDYCILRLKGMKKIGYVKPSGAFYIFCDIAKTGIDSVTFASRLLDEVLVSLIPGEGFGVDEFVRISFATCLPQLEKGMNRIEEWLKKL